VVNAQHLVHNSCSISGWHAGHALDCEEAISFAQLHGIQSLVERFPFSRLDEAVRRLTSGQAKYRVVVVMEE
jgi:D-arabinose 1-dehydrogenase-like Zn-dependent alcohol dehydrogenase